MANKQNYNNQSATWPQLPIPENTVSSSKLPTASVIVFYVMHMVCASLPFFIDFTPIIEGNFTGTEQACDCLYVSKAPLGNVGKLHEFIDNLNKITTTR